jgi:hypothetical protein
MQVEAALRGGLVVSCQPVEGGPLGPGPPAEDCGTGKDVLFAERLTEALDDNLLLSDEFVHKELRWQEDGSVRFGRGFRNGVFDAVVARPERFLGFPQLGLRSRSRRAVDLGSFGSRPLHRTN